VEFADMDYKDYEYKIKGLEEGCWRSINHMDTRTLREVGDLMQITLHSLADKIDEEYHQ
jgi:hypothetical protein